MTTRARRAPRRTGIGRSLSRARTSSGGMRQPWSQLAADVDVDVDTVDVILVEDEVPDEFLALLHELALEAIALRAGSPGDPRQEPAPTDAVAVARSTTWSFRGLGRRRIATLAVMTAGALAVAVVPGVVDTRRAEARLAVLAATPTVLEPMTSPPVELWRVPRRAVSDEADEALDAQGSPRTPSPVEYTLPGGARATWSWHPDGDSGQGSVTREGGGWAFGLWGPPLVPAITDESEPGTLVVLTATGDRLLGRYLGTGRSRWSVPYVGATPVSAAAQVGGVLLLDDGSRLTAIDVRTGGVLWSTPVASAVTRGSALVDGEVVLVPVRDGAAAVELVAHRISDGTEVWRTGTPAGTLSLTVVDHHLVAATGDAIVGMGQRLAGRAGD
ncbi:MAG TPA: PQQ-binding-like beta-propeller repeat protein [Actinotalea sp.]|nr:PQQ-binding-like beta-propeller repeat protein [Actinotalea sp.]